MEMNVINEIEDVAICIRCGTKATLDDDETCDGCGLFTCADCLNQSGVCDGCYANFVAHHPVTARIFKNARKNLNDLVRAGASDAAIQAAEDEADELEAILTSGGPDVS
jgi:hypothetical protein